MKARLSATQAEDDVDRVILKLVRNSRHRRTCEEQADYEEQVDCEKQINCKEQVDCNE